MSNTIPKIPEDLLIGRQDGDSIPLSKGQKGINSTSIGMVKTQKEYVKAYIKEIPFREVLVETICALLGRNLGLPVPRPIWVYSNKDKPPLFGSEDLSYPSLKKFLKFSQLTVSQKNLVLDKWEQYRLTICFDEWIANCDRHTGNILVDENLKIFLIDHGLSIPETLSPSANSMNQLAASIIAGKDDIFLQKLRENLLEIAKSFNASHIARFPSIGTPADPLLESINGFLVNRLPHLQDLIKHQVKYRQGEIPC